MNRSLLILGLVSTLSLPTASFAASAPPSPDSSVSAPASSDPESSATAKHGRHSNQQSSLSQSKKAAREAARSTYLASLKLAQDGRDLAFADANANLLQSLQLAGKDRAGEKAARVAYKAAATGIASAFRQAIATAIASYKEMLHTINGK